MRIKISILTLVALLALPAISLAKPDDAKANENRGNGNKQQRISDDQIVPENNRPVREKEKMNLVKEEKRELKEQEKTERKELKGDEQLGKVKEKALSMINKRIEKLKDASERLTNRKRLQETQRTAITQEVDKAIANLSALKPKVEAATTVEQVKTLIQEAMKSVKVNAVVAPKVKAMSMVSALNNAIARLEKVFPRVQEGINKLPAEKKAPATALLNDAKALMPQLKTQTEAAWKEFSLMKSTDDVATTKAHLEAGKTSFRQAKDTIKQIVQKLNQIKSMLETVTEAPENETEKPETPEVPTNTPTPTTPTPETEND